MGLNADEPVWAPTVFSKNRDRPLRGDIAEKFFAQVLRSNDTHVSTTDPDARLARTSGGHEGKLAYCANVLIENRNGLVVDRYRR